MKFSELLNELKASQNEPTILDVFKNFVTYDERTQNIDVRRLFTLLYNEIPNVTTIVSIDFKKALSWFDKLYEQAILDNYKYRVISNEDSTGKIAENLYVLHNQTFVYFHEDFEIVKVYYNDTNFEFAEKLVRELKVFLVEKTFKSNIQLLINSRRGLDIEPLSITNPNLVIADNYNDDFSPIHEVIYNRINQPKGKGLVLLHGKPGTGKTTYIRHLITSLEKKVIFLPPNMAASMTNPELLSVLIENTDSILVIEDAEKILMNRDQNGASPVSALLNLTDGLLSDCLNIQVICSFNTDLSNLDKALLRKGRLIAKYEFKALSVDKAQNLSNKLGFETSIYQPMILTDIYNQTEHNFQQIERQAIGFN